MVPLQHASFLKASWGGCSAVAQRPGSPGAFPCEKMIKQGHKVGFVARGSQGSLETLKLQPSCDPGCLGGFLGSPLGILWVATRRCRIKYEFVFRKLFWSSMPTASFTGPTWVLFPVWRQQNKQKSNSRFHLLLPSQATAPRLPGQLAAQEAAARLPREITSQATAPRLPGSVPSQAREKRFPQALASQATAS